MNEKTKNYLGLALIVGVLITSFAAWSYARSYGASIEPSSFRSFTVSGEGKVVAVPDVAAFSFSVITQGGKDIAALQKTNTEKSEQAIAFVKERGVDEKDIKTEGYTIEPRYQYYGCREGGTACPPPEIVGYTITQTVSAKVRDFSVIGTVFAGVVSEGANSVSQLNFTFDDPTSVRDEAREKAIKQAKEKARLVAKAAGFSVGRLLGIDDGGYYPMPYRAETLAYSKDSAVGMGGAAPAIEAGSQDVIVNVTLRYEIR